MCSSDLCNEANPHGIGLAWLRKGQVEWRKGLDLADAKKTMRQHKGAMVMHFRYASVGGVCKPLTHPFPVDGGISLKLAGVTDKVLFHNGHWSQWEDYALRTAAGTGKTIPEGALSDTRIIAWMVSLLGVGVLRLVPGKFVLFNAKGINLFGDWQDYEGMLFSNLAWRARMGFGGNELFRGEAQDDEEENAHMRDEDACAIGAEPSPEQVAKALEEWERNKRRQTVGDSMIAYGD